MRNGESSGDRDAPWRSSLALVEAFSGLPPRQLADLEQRLATVSVRRGEVLMHQGHEADALYFVVSGRFAVEVDGRRMAEVGSGSPIGEIAFFADGRRTATVTALRDSIVLKLPRADFVALTERYPAILKPIAVTLGRRLADTLANDELPRSARPRTITVIGIGQSPLPEVFRQRLVKSLSRFGQVETIDSRTLAERFPDETDLESETITNWLNRQETRYHYVLYFADYELSAFNRKAIRQADHVILVGRFRGDSDSENFTPSPTERLAFEIHSPASLWLVLLHESRRPISGTAQWLRKRPVSSPHHIVTDDDADYDRLARFISGNAVGFVASGGGALCAAHIGVYKALTEAGLRFDLMGGTSGGGAMAAAFAMGASPEEVSERTADMFLTSRALKRITWPRYSLLDHTVFDRALKRHYGETEIEDLWTGYFAVSTCLTSNSLCLITRGPVWKAVRATGSIPGLLPPLYLEDGRMLVDGSLLDNAPVKSARMLKSGPNVVVNLRSEESSTGIVEYDTLPSRGQLLLQLLNPFAWGRPPQAPSVATVLLRSLMVQRERLSNSMRPEDFLIAPPLPADIGVMDWHRHAELSARAYDYTSKLIEGLRATGHPLFALR